MTRVFVADDHAVVRCGVSLLLRELGGFDVVGEAEDGRLAAVRRAASGVRDVATLGASPASTDAPPHTTLTRREHQIFMRIVRGAPVVDIAAELDVNACTVSNHLANVRKKLGVNTVADLVRYAIAEGLVESVPGSTPV